MKFSILIFRRMNRIYHYLSKTGTNFSIKIYEIGSVLQLIFT
ncbi:Uncharacterized protein dnm_074440 [Desulfonema magnum]|uniref:Uncharacterized protein n=1 Tax=Desulfonema magnum TaxID=45655 RepID=A0A975GRU0_9BACT|nr:Uncharacterized protein dnm_074440 [Desulfonema magnum]